MTSIFTHQLQPFEENQSPSPVEEQSDPFELHYARSRSRSPPRAAPASPPTASPPKVSPINTLQRQLSGDPESPPPAWKRRPSFSQTAAQIKRSTSQYGPSSAPPVASRPVRSPSDAGGYARTTHLPSRRHPGLMMTSSNPPGGLFLHESPAHSSTSLSDPAADLGLPQPAFRRRPGSGASSNRSSVHSNLDGMNSEDLWSLETDVTPDMSNPNRQAAERPLDTIRRMSRMTEVRPWNTGLPGDVIWPTAPPVANIVIPPVKSKSFTSVPSLHRKSSKLDRKVSKRQQSTEGIAKAAVYVSKTDPNTPTIPRAESIMSSADSSETSLTNPSPMPKTGSNSRPPSAYYSRDFLSSLAPREGGYAIAAMMGSGLGAVGTMSVDDRRRSGDFEGQRSRPPSRAPMAKSAGMRWSLDGGEHYNARPYMTGGSPATTTSNLTGAHINSPEPSPPTDDSRSPSISYLPEGASPPASLATSPSVLQRLDVSSPMVASTSSPINPSPLSRSLSQTLTKSPQTVSANIPVPPIPASPPRILTPQKSKKDLAKEAKAAEKAETVRLAKEKAEKTRVDASRAAKERQEAEKAAAEKKVQEKAAAAKAEAERKAKAAQMKEEVRRKEKEAKEKKKADKEAAKVAAKAATPTPSTSSAPKKGAFGLSAPSLTSLPSAISFSRRASTTDATASKETVPPVPSIPAELGGPSKPFPISTAQEYRIPPPVDTVPRKTIVSAPLTKIAPLAPTTSAGGASTVGGKKKFGFLGTIKKRFSMVDPPRERGGSPAGPTPPPKSPVTPKAGNSGSSADTAIPPTPTPKASALRPIAREEGVVVITAERTGSPAPETFSTPRSSAPSQFAGLSPPVSHPAVMETAVRPPRTSSYRASPQSIRSAIVPNPDEIPVSTVSPSSSVRRSHRGSVHGPRPMPARTRSHSATSRSSQSASVAASSPSLPVGASAGSPPQSFPFQLPQPAHFTAGESAVSRAAPSQSSGSTTGQTASDLASPFSTDGSRKSSMTSADVDAASVAAYLAAVDGEQKHEHTPIREGSDDTIHPDHGAAGAPASGPVIAAH